MKKIILLLMLSFALSEINITTKRVSFEIGPNIAQVDLTDIFNGSNGIFNFEPIYIDNFSTTATIYSEIHDDEIHYWFDGNLGIKLSGEFGSAYCGIRYHENLVSCNYSESQGYRHFIDSNNAVLNLYEEDFEGCSGNSDCNWEITGTLYVDITGPFDDEDTSMGDMNNDGSLNVYDVLIMVGIILDGDSGDIFDVMEIIKRV